MSQSPCPWKIYIPVLKVVVVMGSHTTKHQMAMLLKVIKEKKD